MLDYAVFDFTLQSSAITFSAVFANLQLQNYNLQHALTPHGC